MQSRVSEFYQRCNHDESDTVFLYNRLAEWKRKGLVEPIYSRPAVGRKRLDTLRLTELGKSYFNRSVSADDKLMSLEALTAAVVQLQKEHPELEITFRIRLKDEGSSHTDKLLH